MKKRDMCVLQRICEVGRGDWWIWWDGFMEA